MYSGSTKARLDNSELEELNNHLKTSFNKDLPATLTYKSPCHLPACQLTKYSMPALSSYYPPSCPHFSDIVTIG